MMNFFPATMELETPRVIIRIAQPRDIPALTQIVQNDALIQHTMSDIISNEDHFSTAIQAFECRQSIPMVIIDRDDKKLCGWLELQPTDTFLQINALFIDEEHRHTGILRHVMFVLLSYVMDVVKVQQLKVQTSTHNAAAKAAFLKTGFIPDSIRFGLPATDEYETFSFHQAEWHVRGLQFYGDLV